MTSQKKNTKQKTDIAELTAVGDFVISAAKGKKKATVSIVTGYDYAGSRHINERLSDSALNTYVPVWEPHVDEIPAAQVQERLDQMISGYKQAGEFKIRHGRFAGYEG